MSKNLMYECRSKCLCARCEHVNGNCATCKIQFEKVFAKDIVKQCCSHKGVKKCKYFIEIENLGGNDET